VTHDEKKMAHRQSAFALSAMERGGGGAFHGMEKTALISGIAEAGGRALYGARIRAGACSGNSRIPAVRTKKAGFGGPEVAGKFRDFPLENQISLASDTQDFFIGGSETWGGISN